MEPLKDNLWYQKVLADIRASDRTKQEMEHNFNPSMRNDYDEIIKQESQQAAELLKLGADYEVVDDSVMIEVEDDTFSIPKDLLRDNLGTDQYNLLINHGEEEKEEPMEASLPEDIPQTNGVTLPDGTKIPKDLAPFYVMQQAMGQALSVYTGKPMDQGYPGLQQPKVQSKTLAEILKNISELQQQVINIEEEKNKALNASPMSKEYREKIEALTEQVAEQNETIARLRSDLSKSRKRLEEANNRLDKEGDKSDDLGRQLKKTRAELDDRTADLDKRTKQLESREKELGDKEKELQEKEKQIEALDDEKNRAVAEKENAISEKDRLISKKDREITNLRNHISSLEGKISSLSGKQISEEDKEKLAEYDNLSSKITNLQQKLAKKENERQKLIDEKQELVDKIYEDSLTGLLNERALDRDFDNNDIKSPVVARINICGMEEINNANGYENGDKVISYVADKLKNIFNGEEKVYRSLGAQFVIVGDNASEIRKSLSDIKEQSEADNVFIAYGIAEKEKDRIKDIRKLNDKAADRMNEMRDDIYQDMDSEEIEEPEEEISVPSKIANQSEPSYKEETEKTDYSDDDDLEEDESFAESILNTINHEDEGR